MSTHLSNKEKKSRRMKRYLIEMTQKAIQENGIENISIRKVAQEAGYNSATIYNYFDDFDQLVLFASFKFMKSYSNELTSAVNDSMNALEKYITIFYIFSKYTFSSPEIFWNIFYGKHFSTVDKIIIEYYDFFPDEKGKHNESIMKMLSSGDIYEREYLLVEQIAKEGFINESDISHIVEVAIWTHNCLLNEMRTSKGGITEKEQTKKYTECLKYVLRLAKKIDSKPVPLLDS